MEILKMKQKEDIRWIQRFNNYNNAFNKLNEAIEYIKHNILDENNHSKKENLSLILNDIVKEGLIQRFEYTHELAWNVMKDYAHYQGNADIKGSRDATRYAFEVEIITDGDVWMDMINSRNQTSHTYNEETANAIFKKIIEEYHKTFIEFQKKLQEMKQEEENL